MIQVEIPVKSKRHKQILAGVNARKKLARRRYADRYIAWEEMEKEAVAYIKETTKDRKDRSARDNGGIPTYTTIKVPFSQATYLTALTYWTSVFLSRDPVFQFAARHSSEPGATTQIESLVNYQLTIGSTLVPLYIWLSDVGKYGLGIVGTHWAEDFSTVSTIEEIESDIAGVPSGKKLERVSRRVNTYSGNRIYNVRPQDWFPDPRVSLANFQKGEFCGRYIEVGWNTLLKGAANGIYFNINELRKLGAGGGDPERETGANLNELPDGASDGLTTEAIISEVGTIDLTEMYIELVPKDWDLGQSTYPEKWVFTVARNQIVIGAQPLGELHDKFPFSILTYEIDAYGLYNKSMMEYAQPLNNTLTWLMNSHFYNVRKSLNDMFVVDGQKIEVRDLLNPEPGKIIRALPGLNGADVRTGIMQFPVVDVTQGHMRDMQIIMDLMNRVTGVNDTIMGAVNPGGRKSATEIRTSSSSSINRLKTNAEYFSAQGFQPLGQMLVQSSQQHYTDEQQFRVAGRINENQTHTEVTPENIAGNFDFVAVDGTLPMDRFAQSNLWRQIMVDAASNPTIGSQLDISAIFNQVARLQGIRNLDQFKVEVGSPQALAAEAQAGNTVPVQAKSAPSQIPGIGPTA